jgi:hypothetical protein
MDLYRTGDQCCLLAARTTFQGCPTAVGHHSPHDRVGIVGTLWDTV